MAKVGDVVLYTIQGIAHNAIVLHAHVNQATHLGKTGEPLVHLAFISPERESEIAKKKFNYQPEIFIEYDVVHASHEFSDEYKRQHGLLTPALVINHRGAGEWQEVEDGAAAFESLLKASSKQINEMRDERDKLSAACDAATDYIATLEAQLKQFRDPRASLVDLNETASLPQADGASTPDAPEEVSKPKGARVVKGSKA